MLDLIQFTPPIPVLDEDLRSSKVLPPLMDLSDWNLSFRLSGQRSYTKQPSPKLWKHCFQVLWCYKRWDKLPAVIILHESGQETKEHFVSYSVNFCIKWASNILPRLTHPPLSAPSFPHSPGLSNVQPLCILCCFELRLHCWSVCVQSPVSSSSCWNLV